MSDEEKAALTAASAAKQAERRAIRENAEERARLGAMALMGQRLEADADAVVSRLVGIALRGDDAQALGAIKLLYDRVYGRAVQPSSDVTEERNPLLESFASLSPEERRAVLRLARPSPDPAHSLPSDADPASAQG